jgi:CubicO group peptidase (beta-lactamase class C family)
MVDDIRKALADTDCVSDRSGTQLYVSRKGEPLLDIAVGARDIDVPMTTDTSVLWTCCAKPAVVLALFAVLGRHGLDEHAVVAELVPEFAAAGKDAVTIADLLTHTVPYRTLGLSWVDGRFRDSDEGRLLTVDWDEALAEVCAEPLDGAPGSRVGYTSVANWLVLAEIMQRLESRPYEDVVQERVLDPLGMTGTRLFLGDEDVELAPLWSFGDNRPPKRAPVDLPAHHARRWPGLGARGPAHDLARLLECAAGWRQPELVPDRFRARFSAPLRAGLADPVFRGADIQWGLGFCVDTLPFGLAVPATVIGQTGVRSSLVFADLDRGLTVAFLSSTMPPRPRDWSRKRKVVRSVYAALGQP